MVFVFDEIGDGKYGYKIYFIDFNDGELVYKLVSKIYCYCIINYILIVRIMVYIFDKYIYIFCFCDWIVYMLIFEIYSIVNIL